MEASTIHQADGGKSIKFIARYANWGTKNK